MRGLSRARAIAAREYRSFFGSPVGWTVSAVFSLVAGLIFVGLLIRFRDSAISLSRAGQLRPGEVGLHVNDWIVRPYLYNLGSVLLFFVPLLTMRSMAEERRSGSLDLLLSLPVRGQDLILGKFFGASLTLLSLLAIVPIHGTILSLASTPDWGAAVAGLLGMVLIGLFMVALGVLISSLSQSQIEAGVLTLGVLLLLGLGPSVAESVSPGLARALGFVAVLGRFEDFTRGIIDLPPHLFLPRLDALDARPCAPFRGPPPLEGRVNGGIPAAAVAACGPLPRGPRGGACRSERSARLPSPAAPVDLRGRVSRLPLPRPPGHRVPLPPRPPVLGARTRHHVAARRRHPAAGLRPLFPRSEPSRCDGAPDEPTERGEPGRPRDRAKEPLEMIGVYRETSALRDRAVDLLENYRNASRRIQVRMLDPDRRPEEARALALTRVGVVVVRSGAVKEEVDDLTEEGMTQAILRVEHPARTRILFVSGHGEASVDDVGPSGLGRFAAALRQSGYDAGEIRLFEEEIQSNVAALAVIGPQRTFLPSEIDKLGRYMDAGGRLLLCLEPGADGGLASLLGVRGIGLDSLEVYDESPATRGLAMGPRTLVVTDYASHPILGSGTGYTVFSGARTIALSKEAVWGVDAKTLFRTGPQARRIGDRRRHGEPVRAGHVATHRGGGGMGGHRKRKRRPG